MINVSFYIGHCPIPRTVHSSSHSTPDRLVQSNTALTSLDVSHATTDAQTRFTHKYPSLHIARYSWMYI